VAFERATFITSGAVVAHSKFQKFDGWVLGFVCFGVIVYHSPEPPQRTRLQRKKKDFVQFRIPSRPDIKAKQVFVVLLTSVPFPPSWIRLLAILFASRRQIPLSGLAWLLVTWLAGHEQIAIDQFRRKRRIKRTTQGARPL
jgi:hypothetical protein